ncbi:MAG: hypothetical protein JW791_05515 [Nanoarchaeota archaeon]|nr:hypothetical protein [Nanoarchaeota archaeon]
MRELKRQSFHALFGLTLGFLIYITPPIFFQSLTICLLIALIYLRFLLSRGYKVPVINDYLKSIGRKNEYGQGSFYFLLGALISSLFFEQRVAAVSVLVLGVSDAASTVIGKRFGKHKIYGSKTLEGSSAFFITCFAIVYYFYGLLPALFAGLILTPIELFGGFDDNVIIPPACSLIIVLSRFIV